MTQVESCPALLALVTRGGRVESRHYGHIAICDVHGSVLRSWGDAEADVYMRSAAKPFQAATLLQLGTADRFGWDAADLAVVCASHSSEPGHLAAVRRVLDKASLDEAALHCGPHPPLSDAVRDDLLRAHAVLTPLHSNCSGKHAGMLAGCRHSGWELETYCDLAHPLQQANGATVARFAGVVGELPAAVDGCGVPTYWLRLREMATAFARLGAPTAAPLHHADVSAAAAVSRAMAEHPWLVAGTRRFDTELMRLANGNVIAKCGAEGVMAVAILHRGLGIAVKMADGHSRAHPPVLAKILELLDALPGGAAKELAAKPIRNTVGEQVGDIRAAL